MKIGLFGGTFDPIHVGHLAAARAAVSRFQLDRVLFIPAGTPPHKHRHAPFAERLAMVALACAGESRFVPSSLEAPAPGRPSYSILTVRRVRKQLGAGAELFFLIGADAFLSIRGWQQSRALLDTVNFIVISRPGFDLGLVQTVLPPLWGRRGAAGERCGIEYRLKNTSVFVISDVWEDVSGTDIRTTLPGDKTDLRLPATVAEYLKKTGLYK